MKRIPTFVAGMLTAAVIGGLGVGALAASGAVTFNASALQFNGRQISAKGENYTLDNGQQVPASITYTDETGGGTTYLPVRRIAELLGIEIGWDIATGSVTVAGDVATHENQNQTLSDNKATLESLIGYKIKAFDGMFAVARFSIASDSQPIYTVLYTGDLNEDDFLEYWSSLSQEYTDAQTSVLIEEMRGLNIESGYMDLNFGYGEMGRILLADFRIYQDKTGSANIYQPPMRFNRQT